MKHTLAAASALTAALAASACTPTASVGAQSRAPAPAVVAAGRPVDCVRVADILETKVYDDQTIDFIMRNGTRYRNTLASRCPDLGREKRFGYKITTGNLCSVDTITVLIQGSSIPGPTCGLSQFAPVALAR
uniref:DUF6491 family protein n=1 Tax=Altererythrobacter segetis TaxID=1104773 RepID=UPI00140D61AC|nr:DUF6491 family protein [Altererythrobacter segetis]